MIIRVFLSKFMLNWVYKYNPLFTERQSEIIQLHPDSTFCDISIKKMMVAGLMLRYHGRDTSAHGIKL